MSAPTPRPLQLGAEVCLTVITMSVVVGMGRLFAGSEWLAPLLVHAVIAHLVVAVVRRRGWSIAASAAVAAISAEVLITLVSYPSTTVLGFPSDDSLTAMREDLTNAWTLYQDVVAPVPVETGFIVASALAVWAVAFVADWAAFRLWVPFEATLPAGTLFLFSALLGEEAGQGWAIGTFAAATLAFFLVHRMSRQSTTSHWVAGRTLAGRRWLIAAGVGLGATAVLLGTVVGPQLPGADADGLINPRGIGPGEGSRVTISPLVDIRSRLINQSEVVAFEVASPQPAYWRLTSLDSFDGSIWRSSGSYQDASGTLPRSTDEDVQTTTFEQSFTIAGLSAIWLPSAYEPRAVDAGDVAVLFDDVSSTLIVGREVADSNGLGYQVVSEVPRLTAANLSGEGEIPSDVSERYLALPEEFPQRVVQLAGELTAGAADPYQRALALQNHLRTFTYDLNVGSGHSDAVLEQFLFETKRGYCEQFAGSFAAMARSIGLPARVAVGFTQGVHDITDPTRYIVRGEHAHAWPEVYFAGAGWVSFEPTPGRGQPFAEAYTGVAPAQAASADPGVATTAPPTTVAEPTATIPESADAPDRGIDDDLDAVGDPVPDSSEGGGGLLTRYVLDPMRRAGAVLLLLAGLYLVAFPLTRYLARARRRQHATSPSQRIVLAWTEATEAAALHGYRERRTDTFAERARRLAQALDDPALVEPTRRLARSLDLVHYSAGGADELEASLATEASATIVEVSHGRATTWMRLRPWLDPRPSLAVARRRLRRPSEFTLALRSDRERDEDRAPVPSGGR